MPPFHLFYIIFKVSQLDDFHQVSGLNLNRVTENSKDGVADLGLR